MELPLGDETTTIILNTKGTLDDVSPEIKMLLDYIDGKELGDIYTKELDEAVMSTRKNEKWKGAKRPVDVCSARTGTEWRRAI